MRRIHAVLICLVIVGLFLTACGQGQLLGPKPKSTPVSDAQPAMAAATVQSTQSINTPVPTLAPISESDIAYFRGMLANPSAKAMLEMKPPDELFDVHMDLAGRQADAQIAHLQLVSAAISGSRSSFQSAETVAEAANMALEIAWKRAYLLWEKYLARFGLKLPTDNNAYRDIAFRSPDDGWIVGAKGTMLHYDGRGWQTIASPTDADLYAIYLSDDGSGWILGVGGTLLRYQEGAWKQQASPTSLPTVVGMQVIAANSVWILASDSAEENVRLELFHYDGSSWQRDMEWTTPTRVAEFRMLDDQTGWITLADSQKCLLFLDGAWVETSFPFQYDFWNIKAVQLLDASAGWAVGDAGRVYTLDGKVWKAVESPTEEYLYDIYMADAKTGWAVGADGTLLRYDGNRWQTEPSGTSDSLYTIQMYEHGLGWITGGDTLLRYAEGKWVKGDKPFTGWSMRMAVVGPDDAWTIGLLNTIAHFDGKAWEIVHQWPFDVQ